jgi:4-carboxymuconolactone decarboxylase
MTGEELREVTRKTAAMLFGPPKPGEGAYQLWRQFDPELARHMSLFYTGRLYAREVISQKQRELCAVAALTVLHRLEELRWHIGAALNVGATKEEVAEVIFQMMTYGGVPTTVEGLKSARPSSKNVASGRRPERSAAVSGAAAVIRPPHGGRRRGMTKRATRSVL